MVDVDLLGALERRRSGPGCGERRRCAPAMLSGELGGEGKRRREGAMSEGDERGETGVSRRRSG